MASTPSPFAQAFDQTHAPDVDSEAAIDNSAASAHVHHDSEAVALLPKAKRVTLPKPTSAPHFAELDALRGFCTCIVVTGHFWFAFGDREPILGLINASTMSLDVFFIMSGHVIAYGYLMDGKAKTLISSAVRRFPRLLLPALFANLLAWVFSELGGFSAQGQWRKLSPNGQWCSTCFGTAAKPDLTISWALVSAKNLIFSFGGGSWSFPWEWTISVELFGSIVVFMLAPFFRFIVHFRAAEADEPGPFQLQRLFAISIMCFTGLLTLSKIGESWFLTLRSSTILPDGSSDNEDIVQYFVVMLQAKTGQAFLFIEGLALAQASIIIRASLQGEISWAHRMKAKWDEMCITKWVIPLCLIIVPISFPALIECIDDPTKICPVPRTWDQIKPIVLLLAPLSVMTGVLISPPEFRSMMANSIFHFLGRISFSIYLMHFFVIFSIGMFWYVWLNHRYGSLATLALMMVMSAGPLLIISYLFWYVVEDPLGMRLPRKVVAFAWQQLEKGARHPAAQMLPVQVRGVLHSFLGKAC